MLPTIDHKIIDSHCHYDMLLEKGLKSDDIFSTLKELNVEGFVQISTNKDEIIFAVNAAKQNIPLLSYTIGFHPNDVGKCDYSDSLKLAQEYSYDPKFGAVGEIGLDYFYEKDPKLQSLQIDIFNQFLDIAQKINKPVCVHTRDAHEDTLQSLKNFTSQKILIHCFTGDSSQIQDYLDLGCYISFSGIVTFKNAIALQEAAKICPPQKMLVETDAPFLTPVPYRGRLNQPGYTRYVLDYIANLKGMSSSELSQLTYRNTKEFYNII